VRLSKRPHPLARAGWRAVDRARTDGAAAPSSLGSAEVCGWTLLVVGLAYWGNVLRTAGPTDATGLAFAVNAVVQHGAFCLAAWVMIVVMGLGAPPAGSATRAQIGIAVAVCVLSAAPTRQAVMLALIGGGLCLVRPSGTRTARAIRALLLGLAAEMAWTSTYLMPLHDAVATLDARAVQWLLRLCGIGVVAQGNIVAHVDTDFSIEILSFCASSYPLASVGLAFVVTTAYQGRLPSWRDLPWAIGSAVASIALSEVRLAWMAVREADYRWLHDGGGVTVYGLAAVGLATVLPLLATLHRPAPVDRA